MGGQKIAFLVLSIPVFAGLVAGYELTGKSWDASHNPVYYDIDSSVPSSWETPIINSENTWDAASYNFYFTYSDGGGNGNWVKLGTVDEPGKIARTRIWTELFDSSDIRNAETVFDQAYSWSTSGSSNAYDVKNTMTHEFGHWLALNEEPDISDATMYPYIYQGETKKRTLDQDDIDGIREIYDY